MKISLVVPSLNQGRFIEETILSIINQDYEDVELIIIDGQSRDDSCDIIRRYANKIAYWRSEPDNGSADALNKGFRIATGEILGYINSDDILLQGALNKVNERFVSNRRIKFIVGKSLIISSDSKIIDVDPGLPPSLSRLLYLGTNGFMQPACFWHRDVYRMVGDFKSAFQYAYDYDYFVRIIQNVRAHRINSFLAGFRMHPTSKTSNLKSVKEREDRLIRHEYLNEKAEKLYYKSARALFFLWVAFHRKINQIRYKDILNSRIE